MYSLLHISKHTKVFDHPVTELFMLLKLRKLLWVIWGSIILHVSIATPFLTLSDNIYNFEKSYKFSRFLHSYFTQLSSFTCTLKSVLMIKTERVLMKNAN